MPFQCSEMHRRFARVRWRSQLAGRLLSVRLRGQDTGPADGEAGAPMTVKARAAWSTFIASPKWAIFCWPLASVLNKRSSALLTDCLLAIVVGFRTFYFLLRSSRGGEEAP